MMNALDFAKSKEPFSCELEGCIYNQTKKQLHRRGTVEINICNLESQDECPYHSLFHQVREEAEQNKLIDFNPKEDVIEKACADYVKGYYTFEKNTDEIHKHIVLSKAVFMSVLSNIKKINQPEEQND